MPAERPQGIGPLYVSPPQIARVNYHFPRKQWKTNSNSTCGTAIPGCALHTLRDLRALSSATSVVSLFLFFPQKTKNGATHAAPQTASGYLISDIRYLPAIYPSKLHFPKLHLRTIQFQSQFPPSPSLMPAPHQSRFRRSTIHQIRQLHLLSHREPLLHHHHASLRADIHRVPVRLPQRSILAPRHAHRHSRIQPRPGPQMLHLRYEFRFIHHSHGSPRCVSARNIRSEPPQFPFSRHTQFSFLLTLISLTASVNGTYFPIRPISYYPRYPPPAVDLFPAH